MVSKAPYAQSHSYVQNFVTFNIVMAVDICMKWLKFVSDQSNTQKGRKWILLGKGSKLNKLI